MSRADAAYLPRLRPPAVPGLAAAALAALRARDGSADVQRFECDAAAVLGNAHAVVFASARAGMAATLRRLGLTAGDEVLVPAYTAPCVPAFLRAEGYRVLAAPICPRRLVVTADSIAGAITARTRAVLPTHVEGVTAPMDEIAALLAPRGIALLEDAAHAFGAHAAGKPVGAFSAGAAFSLGKGKHLNTLFGGIIATDRPDLADALRAERDAWPAASPLRVLSASMLQAALEAATNPGVYPWLLHPLLRAFDGLGVDIATRLFEERDAPPDPAAMRRRAPCSIARIGSLQLPSLHGERLRRRALARRLREALAARGLPHQEEGGPGDNPLTVTLFHRDRDALRRALLARGVDTQPTWMRAIRSEGADHADRAAERAAREGLYLPLYAGLEPNGIGALLRALDGALASAPRGAA